MFRKGELYSTWFGEEKKVGTKGIVASCRNKAKIFQAAMTHLQYHSWESFSALEWVIPREEKLSQIPSTEGLGWVYYKLTKRLCDTRYLSSFGAGNLLLCNFL